MWRKWKGPEVMASQGTVSALLVGVEGRIDRIWEKLLG
jgi:DNA transposition AAA+ family ATPase